MSFLDAADLPRAHILRDSSRRYRGLSYDCSYAPQIPISRPLPPRRDSAVGTSLQLAKSHSPSTLRTTRLTMTVSLEPFTASDILAAIAVQSSITNDPAEAREARLQEWNLALENPFARIFKATLDGNLIGAVGFLTHEVGGLQWTSGECKESVGSVERESDYSLEEAREEVLKGDYDLWHIYLSFIAPTHQGTSTWSDMFLGGLSQADEAWKRVYVQSSAAERAMYEILGFEVKKALRLREGDRYLMLRPAKV